MNHLFFHSLSPFVFSVVRSFNFLNNSLLVYLFLYRLYLLREFAIFFRFVSLETRLKAEADAATAAGGLEVTLDLKDKMGMVVNPGENSLNLSRFLHL